MRLTVVLIAIVIFTLGLLTLFSATSGDILDHNLDKNTHQVLIKQVCYALIGVFLGILIYCFGHEKIISASPYLMVFFSFLLLLTLIPGIGKEVNGAKRWLSFGGVSLQPSEFFKYVAPAYFIWYCRRFFLKNSTSSFTIKAFLPLLLTLFLPILLILLEPNNGTVLVIMATLTVCCFLEKIPMRLWAAPLVALLVLFGTFAVQMPYVSARLKVYLNPESDLKGKGHQPYQAKIAVGSGGLTGKGPGNSLQKLSYLPEAQNDYIAAIYAEEFGFIGVVFLILLYLLLATNGFAIALRAGSEDDRCYAGAITFLISLQAVLNLGVVSGVIPSTGLNLPLFSQGGSSLMATLIGLAILLSISSGLPKMGYQRQLP